MLVRVAVGRSLRAVVGNCRKFAEMANSWVAVVLTASRIKYRLSSLWPANPNISYPSTATCGKADGYGVKLEFGLERYVLIQPSVKIQVVPCPMSLRTASRHEEQWTPIFDQKLIKISLVKEWV